MLLTKFFCKNVTVYYNDVHHSIPCEKTWYSASVIELKKLN